MLEIFFKFETKSTYIDGFCLLRIHLCADEYINVSVDTRTGRITLRDTGSLSASGRAARYSVITDRINENPGMVCEVVLWGRDAAVGEGGIVRRTSLFLT